MTQHFVARDAENGTIVANRVTVASRRLDRAVGLLGRSHLEAGEALWITPAGTLLTSPVKVGDRIQIQ